MMMLLLFFVNIASAQWFDQGWNLEAAFGISNQEITNPNGSKAVYDGYGGHALAFYPIYQKGKYSFGPAAKYFYSELENKANTGTLNENIKFYGVAPGLELKLCYLILGYNYRYQWLSVDMSGSQTNTINSRWNSSEFLVGIEIPANNWAFRFYYSRSSSDIPRADTGLTLDSPWAEENFYLAIRYRFGASSSSSYRERTYDNPGSNSDSSALSSERGSEPPSRYHYRTIRYSPRPSANIK